MAIDASGGLVYFQNSSWSNPGGLPFTTSRIIGSGWGPQLGIRMQSTNDLTGDGYADLVAVRSDGTLVAYYNNMNANPGRVPYTSGTVVGSGWQPFTSFTLGDVNGDGLADLIAERTDGTYWLYTNHYWANPGHLPFTSGVPMPVPGDDSMSGFAAADINSDGYADLFGMAGWMNLNRTPAGNPRPFLDSFSVLSGQLGGLPGIVPRAGWAIGHYRYGTVVTGLLLANPNGDGTLQYVEDPTGSPWTLAPKVIGSGWQAIRQLIS